MWRWLFFGFFIFQIIGEVSQATVSKEEFWSLLTQIDEIYAPKFEKENRTLTLLVDWDLEESLAQAIQRGYGARLEVSFALAQEKEMTLPHLAFILCHELGHLRGAVKFRAAYLSWASPEGEADYFASSSCFPRLIELEVINLSEQQVSDNVDVSICTFTEGASEKKATARIKLCKSYVEFTHSLLELLAQLKKSPQRQIPYRFGGSKGQETRNSQAYPPDECRFDTIISGFVDALLHKKQLDRFSDERFACWTHLAEEFWQPELIKNKNKLD